MNINKGQTMVMSESGSQNEKVYADRTFIFRYKYTQQYIGARLIPHAFDRLTKINSYTYAAIHT